MLVRELTEPTPNKLDGDGDIVLSRVCEIRADAGVRQQL
jgi:hypothetical protein